MDWIGFAANKDQLRAGVNKESSGFINDTEFIDDNGNQG
jgi:hypothetical protein